MDFGNPEAGLRIFAVSWRKTAIPLSNPSGVL
jgi:hypothetical protein